MKIQSVEDCIGRKLKVFDLSTTPFQFPPFPSLYQYSFFNCSTSKGNLWAYSFFDEDYVTCLDSPGYRVIVTTVDSQLFSLNLEFCTKMYDSVLVPNVIFDAKTVLSLNWSLPDCKTCEMHGGICSREIGANQIRCFQASGLMKIIRIVGAPVGFLIVVLATSVIYLTYSRKKVARENQRMIKKFLEDYTAMKLTRYSYAEIRKMTNDFKDQLGEGSYGNVFGGKVSDDISVAVKLLHNSSGNGEEFINEVGTMGKIHHANVVRLFGYCADGFKRALVYEFLPNGSLDKFIFPEFQEEHDHKLGMVKMQEIAIGIARGIEYLHQGCEQRILHFDIKPHNILLDENYKPKISDFGLAKLCEKGRSAISMTVARGTMGYIAPEVFSRQFGNVSYKSDIYSFGMLLLEMAGRRKNRCADVQSVSQMYFPEWVYGCLVKQEELRIQADQLEEGDDDHDIMKKLAIVALWCIQWNPVNRPNITGVLQMLQGNSENLMLPPNPFTSGNAMNPTDPSSNHTRMRFDTALEVISEFS